MTPLINVIGLIVNWVTGSPEAARKKKGHGKDMRAETTGSLGWVSPTDYGLMSVIKCRD